MAIKTFYPRSSLATNSAHLALQDGGIPPTLATTGTGWTVGTTAAGNYARMSAQVERAATTFSTTAQPDGAPSLVDCLRTPLPLEGNFAAGNVVCSFPVIAVSAGSNQDGRICLRLWRSRFPDGSGAVEITSSAGVGTTVTNLTTLVAQISIVTLALPAFALAREYLFFQVAWEITGAGSTSGRDVLLQIGVDATLITTDFGARDLTTWTDQQLLDDLTDYATALQTAKDNFASNNQALLTDPTNTALRDNYATLDAARDQVRIDLNPVLAEMQRREGG